jgi:hypothetical protein
MVPSAVRGYYDPSKYLADLEIWTVVFIIGRTIVDRGWERTCAMCQDHTMDKIWMEAQWKYHHDGIASVLMPLTGSLG